MYVYFWKVDILVNGCLVSFKFDSGVDVFVILEKIFGFLLIQEKFFLFDKKLYGLCKVLLFCKGKFIVFFMYNL